MAEGLLEGIAVPLQRDFETNTFTCEDMSRIANIRLFFQKFDRF